MPLFTPLNVPALCSMPLVVAHYYDGGVTAGGMTATTMTASQISYNPIMFSRTVTIDRIGVNVTAIVASSAVRVGIYNADPVTGLPTTRLLDGGSDLVGTAIAGVQNTVAVTLQANILYWLACGSNATPPTLTHIQGGIEWGGGFSALTDTSRIGKLTSSWTPGGALPDPANTIAYASGANSPSIRVRLATVG